MNAPFPNRAAAAATGANPGTCAALLRVGHAAFVLVVVACIILPSLPRELGPKLRPVLGPVLGPRLGPALLERIDPIVGKLRAWTKVVSWKQRWGMYAPNPQRSQVYMNLTAVYSDGRTRALDESEHETGRWGTHWMWDKTRVDIWRQYANFRPKKRNDNRSWYLKGVCVREARSGEIPHRVTMEHVRRRFTKPDAVRAGADPLGPPKRRQITLAYCKNPVVLRMIEADRARRGANP